MSEGNCPICKTGLELKNDLLYCPSCKVFIGDPNKKSRVPEVEDVIHEDIKKESKFKIFGILFKIFRRILFLVILVGVAFWGFSFFEEGDEACIPIESVLLFDSPKFKQNVIEAIERIKQISAEDYYRLCAYGNSIHLIDISGYGGFYRHGSDPITGNIGYIQLDRLMISLYEHLDSVIVHEACHAYLYQEFLDRSEEPCEDREREFIAKKPEIEVQDIVLLPHESREEAQGEVSGELEKEEKITFLEKAKDSPKAILDTVKQHYLDILDRAKGFLRKVPYTEKIPGLD